MYTKIRIGGSGLHHFLIRTELLLYFITTLFFIIYDLFGNGFWFRLGYLLMPLECLLAAFAIAGYLSWRKPKLASQIGVKYLIFSCIALAFCVAGLFLLYEQFSYVSPEVETGLMLAVGGSGSFLAAALSGWRLTNIPDDAPVTVKAEISRTQYVETMKVPRPDLRGNPGQVIPVGTRD